MRTRRTRVGVAVLALMLAAVLAAANAGADTVNVVFNNGTGSRALSVETVSGTPLTAIDFDSSDSFPFAVKVVDTDMTHTAFTITAEMTKLYFYDGVNLLANGPIPSSSIGISSTLASLASGVDALVQPVYDVVLTIPGGLGSLCATLQTLNLIDSCNITLENVAGDALALVGDLGISGLPILPQNPQIGDFSCPAYDYPTMTPEDDPSDVSCPAATDIEVLKGNLNVDAAFLTSITDAVTDIADGITTLAGLNTATGIDTSTLVNELVGQIGLDNTQANAVLGLVSSVAATVDDTTGILSQTGTYKSFPVLDLTVPTGDAAPVEGTYKGTLVVTGF
jgi:hypothetical protein